MQSRMPMPEQWVSASKKVAAVRQLEGCGPFVATQLKPSLLQHITAALSHGASVTVGVEGFEQAIIPTEGTSVLVQTSCVSKPQPSSLESQHVSASNSASVQRTLPSRSHMNSASW